MSGNLSAHARLECDHAFRVRHGDARPLSPLDPVPGCQCVRCVLLDVSRDCELEPGMIDLLMTNVLPALAARLPIERRALAERLRAEWTASAFLVLPSAELLAELAARMPGARKAPRPVADDPDPLPVEAARRADILAVCEGLGIELKRCGGSFRGDCPFHDSASGTSFTVSPDKNLFHCFGCGRGGDVIELYRRVSGADFPNAVRAVAATEPQPQHEEMIR